MPETVYSVARQYQKSKQIVPLLFVKLYVYQLARALAHIHGLGICHRDIKPQNLLLDPETHILKLCDFGSAKFLVKGEPNVSYICSRYYRAPELIFGSTNYTTAIDIWSEGRWLVTCSLGWQVLSMVSITNAAPTCGVSCTRNNPLQAKRGTQHPPFPLPAQVVWRRSCCSATPSSLGTAAWTSSSRSSRSSAHQQGKPPDPALVRLTLIHALR